MLAIRTSGSALTEVAVAYDEVYSKKKNPIFEKLHSIFINERDSDKSEGKKTFRAAWKERFNALDPKIQNRIVEEVMKECLTGYEQAKKADSVKKDAVLSIVRDLVTLESPIGIFDPIDDGAKAGLRGVPKILEDIAAEN